MSRSTTPGRINASSSSQAAVVTRMTTASTSAREGASCGMVDLSHLRELRAVKPPSPSSFSHQDIDRQLTAAAAASSSSLMLLHNIEPLSSSPPTSKKATATIISTVSEPPHSCWMCDCCCPSPGWTNMPVQFRSVAPLKSAVGAATTTIAEAGRSHSNSITSLTLCTRCATSLSLPPGTKIMDVVHQCNATHTSRTRSHTFIAFLREYKILLELIAMEYEDRGFHSVITLDNVGMDNVSSILTQLIECIGDTLEDGDNDGPRRGGTTRVRHHAHGGGGGAEWILKPSERLILLRERKRLDTSLSVLSKRRDLSEMDRDRHQQHNYSALRAASASKLALTMSSSSAATAAAAVSSPSPVTARQRVSGSHALHNDKEIAIVDSKRAIDKLPLSSSVPTAETESGNDTSLNRREALIQFFSSASQEQTSREDMLRHIFPGDGSDVVAVSGRGTSEEQHRQVANSAVETTPRAASSMRSQSLTQQSRQHHRDTLQVLAQELDALRHEQEIQRVHFQRERDAIILERDSLRAELNAQMASRSSLERQLHTVRAQWSSVMESSERQSHVMDEWARSAALWLRHVSDLFCSYESKLALLFAAECSSVVAHLVEHTRTLGDQLETVRLAEGQKWKQRVLVSKAREHLALSREGRPQLSAGEGEEEDENEENGNKTTSNDDIGGVPPAVSGFYTSHSGKGSTATFF